MYLQMLEPESRELFAQAALRMASRDGNDSPEEGELISNLIIECELDEIPESRSMQQILKEIPGVFTDDLSRRIVLLELAGVVEIDGDSNEAELKMLSDVAKVLSITESQVEKSLEFARKMRALALEGNVLLISETEE